jgi:hypothetical protein
MTVVLHCQKALFHWVSAQSGLTGAIIFAAGLLFAFYGFRMSRLLVGAWCGGLGYGVGLVLGPIVDLPEMWAGAGVGMACAAAAFACPTAASVVASGSLWALLGAYLAAQAGLNGAPAWIGLGLLGGGGTLMTLVSRRAMTALLTSIQGGALMLVGFAAVARAVIPAVGATMVGWAEHRSAVLPILLLMLSATGYSCQANQRRGDIRTGPQDSVGRIPGRSRPSVAQRRS